jgi:hypothetical protein
MGGNLNSCELKRCICLVGGSLGISCCARGGLVPSTRRLAGRLEHQRTLDAGVLWYGMGESKVTKNLAASVLLVLFRALFGLFSLGSQRQRVGYRDGFH